MPLHGIQFEVGFLEILSHSSIELTEVKLFHYLEFTLLFVPFVNIFFIDIRQIISAGEKFKHCVTSSDPIEPPAPVISTHPCNKFLIIYYLI